MYSPAEIDDVIKMRGRLVLHLQREDGSEQITEIDNLVVTAGKGVIADRMKAAPAKAAMGYMAVGTTATAPAIGDTALGAEVAASRTALTSTGVVGAVITYICSFGPGIGTGSLSEAGIFNAGAAGDMLARTTFATIPKNAGDTLGVTWTVTVG